MKLQWQQIEFFKIYLLCKIELAYIYIKSSCTIFTVLEIQNPKAWVQKKKILKREQKQANNGFVAQNEGFRGLGLTQGRTPVVTVPIGPDTHLNSKKCLLNNLTERKSQFSKRESKVGLASEISSWFSHDLSLIILLV